ncbi:GNAT family N-acetyltransferase [Oxalobacteraceae sp. CFBP 13730]|nr:GNAT family N-acetyltransferase [Oxalobacteraceae sp. CFBP 13730]
MHASALSSPADSITCHVGQIPAGVEEALVTTYASLHSSLAFFKVFRSIEGASCYLARCAGAPSTVLLFTFSGHRIDVINEMIEIGQAEMTRFVAYVFAHFPQIDVISFKALKTPARELPFPVQQYRAKGSYVITLPDTPEAYTARIGKSTRASIHQGRNGIRRHFPSFQSRFFVNDDIDENHIRAIVALSERKINAGDAVFFYDVGRLVRLARLCGFVHVILIDGRICAGSVNYQVGTSFFGDAMGHDPQYEKFGLGKLCVYLTICESIVRGGTRFYLGGGVFAFKERLLGVPFDMDEVHVYRSSAKLLRHIGHAIGVTLAAALRSAKHLVHQHKHTRWARLVVKSFCLLQRRK